MTAETLWGSAVFHWYTSVAMSTVESGDLMYATDDVVPDDVREALRVALDADHPEGQCDRSCDIDVAREEGFLLASAWLLDGATETPNLDAWRARFGVTRDLSWWQDGAGGWIDYHREHGVKCEDCGGFTYGDGETAPEVCGGCRRPLDEPMADWEYDLAEWRNGQ